MTLKIETLAIGDELLDGRLADTNSQMLARDLVDLGITLSRQTVVGDAVEEIAEAVRRAAERADIVVTSGGLGPTTDDLTAEGVAQAAGVSIRLDEPSWERIQSLFAARGLELPENNRRQAEVPESARILENQKGVAPGFVTEVGSAEVWSFPGVPREFQHLQAAHLIPHLKERLSATSLFTETLRCLGATESKVGSVIEPIEGRYPNLRFQYRAHFPEILLRLVGSERAEVERAADEAEEAIGRSVYGRGEASLAERVLHALEAAGQTLATAESCTGGLIAKTLTDVPGASRVYRGSVVAYEDDVKVALLDVEEATLKAHGAVSQAVATQMAEGARTRLRADWAVSTTGIAGPGGGTLEKPVGTVCIALAGPRGTKARTLHLPIPERERIRSMSAAVALRELLSAFR